MNKSRYEIDRYGNKCWFNEEGKLHRTDGPAVEWGVGINKQWWVNGLRHRIDGPAIEYYNGYKEWWVNGVRYTEEEFNEIVEYELFKQELGELFKI
jgi:hypothetical protein